MITSTCSKSVNHGTLHFCICYFAIKLCSKLSNSSTIVCSISYVQLATTFTLNFGVYGYFLQLDSSIDLSWAARIIHNTHGIYSTTTIVINGTYYIASKLVIK